MKVRKPTSRESEFRGRGRESVATNDGTPPEVAPVLRPAVDANSIVYRSSGGRELPSAPSTDSPSVEAQRRARLDFETLLSELSATFASVPVEKTDEQIKQGLKKLGESLRVDRVSILRLSADRKSFQVSHCWAGPESDVTGRVLAIDQVPWITELLSHGVEVLRLSRREDCPSEALEDTGILREERVQSNATVPLMVGGSVVGALAFDSFREIRVWSDDRVKRLRLIGEILANALMRKQNQEALEHRLRFEELLGDLSSRFVRIPAHQVAEEIEQGLRKIVEFLEVDRGALYEFNDDQNRLDATHRWTRPGCDPPLPLLWREQFPWVSGRLQGGEVVAMTTLEDLPAEAMADRKRCRALGIKSLLSIPLSVGGTILGGMSFSTRNQEIEWPRDLVARLRLIGEVFANAVLRARREEELRGARERSLTILASLRDQISILDAQGNILAVNEAWEQFGWENALSSPACAGPGANYLDVCRRAADDGDSFAGTALEGIQSVLDGTRKEFTLEYPCDSPTERRWFLMKVMPLKSPEGGVIVTHGNITARKNAEELLLKSEERYRTVVRDQSELICRYLPDSTLTFVNDSYCRYFDRKAEDLLGKPFLPFLPPEDREAVRQRFERLSFDKPVATWEHRVLMPNGEVRWHQWTNRALCNEEKQVVEFQAVGRDITLGRRAEEDIRHLRMELAHVSRVTTVGELAASIAHELNQPLAAILSNAQAARRFLDGDSADLEEVRSALADIVEDDRRAGEVISRLRSLLRRGELEQTPIHINDAVREILVLLKGELLASGITVQLDLSPGLPAGIGDRVQIQQVILNLVMNAVEAMGSLPQERTRDLRIRTAVDPIDTLRVSMEDSGVGISPEGLRRVFTPFFTTKPDGMGMGLVISRSIIEAHGGQLGIISNADRGVTVFFTLPVYRATGD